MALLFDPAPVPTLLVAGTDALFPVRRIFCVGRNYADHAREMGHEPDREAPFYFLKSAAHMARAEGTVPFPPGTDDYHHEMELAVALGAAAFEVAPAEAMGTVFGYACALDMTRRDRQAEGKAKRRPWDLGKDVEASALLGAITPAERFGPLGAQRIEMDLDGEIRQRGTLDLMIHAVPEVIADLSRFYRLGPGDLILTGTPAGVGPVRSGQTVEGRIDGCAPIRVTFA